MEEMSLKEQIATVIGAFVATIVASFFSLMILEAEHTPMILASTGASAMLIFALPHAKVSQPWNLVGGHLVSAFVGVSCCMLISNDVLASSIAIPLAMISMHVMRCLHPPGGATAVTAVIGGSAVESLGYAFLIIPVFFNSIILLSFVMAAGTFREDNPFAVR